MLRFVVFLFCAFSVIVLGTTFPQHAKSRRPVPAFKNNTIGGLILPDNATLIRDNIVDNFSCKDRIYGYYADMENDCQIFHVCLPQTRNAMRWSFICPAETVFNQATFVCTRTENSIPCEESEKFYSLNEAIGKEVEEEEETDVEDTTHGSENDIDTNANIDVAPAKVDEPSSRTSRILNRRRHFRRL